MYDLNKYKYTIIFKNNNFIYKNNQYICTMNDEIDLTVLGGSGNQVTEIE
jgi:hypothetical protein